ncbi:MAG TPA: NUDIX hydrolase, partial [Propionibacteriaceae bacterium]|nr:NUDIX hydrolase [Propionibacteriaceae bacterium]
RHPAGFRFIEPPAGLLDVVDEDPLLAAQRELAEEAELAATDWRVLVDVFTSPGCNQESIRVFLARGLTRTGRPDGFELAGEEAHMELRWAPLAELVAAIYAGTVQNPTMVIGTLALHAARLEGRLDALRTPDVPWPARTVKAQLDAARQ